MASVWIDGSRRTKKGQRRYRVLCRLGGRESKQIYLGTFKRKADAEARKRWAIGEIAAMRVPDISALIPAPSLPSFEVGARAWKDSRIDLSDESRRRVENDIARIFRVKPELARKPVDEFTYEEVNEVIAALREAGYAPGTIRLCREAMAGVFGFHRVNPNPARDRTVKLPRREPVDLPPPLAEHIERVMEVIPVKHVLPLLIIEACGMRVQIMRGALLGDIDEERRAIRVRAGIDKRHKQRHLVLPEDLFDAWLATLPPRIARDLQSPAFPDVTDSALRGAIASASKATGVPRFSPHGLRRRRGSLHYKKTGSLAEVAELLGDSVRVASAHYIYAMTDYREVDRTRALERVREVLTWVPPSNR